MGYMQEMNHALAVPPSKIRLPGAIDLISDTMDTEGNQDWYLCSSKKFLMSASAKTVDKARLEEFTKQFQLGFRWISTDEGIRFEPVPNPSMASALRVNHKNVAEQFRVAAEADALQRLKLDTYKREMSIDGIAVENVPVAPPDMPMQAAGPRGRGLEKEKPMPVQVGDR